MIARRPVTVTLTFDECRLLAREAASRAAHYADLAVYFARTPNDNDDPGGTPRYYARMAVQRFALAERLLGKYYGYLHLPDARGCVAEWVENDFTEKHQKVGGLR